MFRFAQHDRDEWYNKIAREFVSRIDSTRRASILVALESIRGCKIFECILEECQHAIN
jgi:hypothetical protein